LGFDYVEITKSSFPCSNVADRVPGFGAFLIRDPGWLKKRSRSGMNITDHIFESLETFFWVKQILEVFILIRIRDPESF
jgi:hypothetical protein